LQATKLAEGGTIGGKSHAEGGNKYVSLDGNSFMEHERGEEVTKKSSAEKHRKLLKAINKDDFSGLSVHDVSIQDLLKGTGVYAQMEKAQESSEKTVVMHNTYVSNPKSKESGESEQLKKLNAKFEKFAKEYGKKVTVTDMGDHVLITQGNKIQRFWKKQ
jgi:hypothetical protein